MSKGQSQIIEIVILFGVGVVIVAGFVTAFESFGENVRDEAIENQGKAFGDVVSSNIAFLLSTGADHGEVNFLLPNSIANEYYSVVLSDSGVEVNLGGRSFVSHNLNGMENFYDLQGSFVSDFETANVRMDGKNVSIGG